MQWLSFHAPFVYSIRGPFVIVPIASMKSRILFSWDFLMDEYNVSQNTSRKNSSNTVRMNCSTKPWAWGFATLIHLPYHSAPERSLIGMNHSPPSVLSFVICEGMFNNEPLCFVERKKFVIEGKINNRLWWFECAGLAEGKEHISIQNSLVIDSAPPLRYLPWTCLEKVGPRDRGSPHDRNWPSQLYLLLSNIEYYRPQATGVICISPLFLP